MQTTPPLSTTPLSFHLPPVQEHRLSDGTPVYVIPRENQDVATLWVRFGSGNAHDTCAGATPFAVQLLTRGTAQRTPEEWDDAVESLGCRVTSGSTATTTTVTGMGLAEHLPTVISLMAECIRTPRFDDTEFETLRGQWISTLTINLHDPDWLASEASSRVCFPDHPYYQIVLGNAEYIRGISISQIREAYTRIIRSSRSIYIAGPVGITEMLPQLEQIVAGLPVPDFENALPQAHQKSGVALIAINAEATQSVLRISLPSIGYNHPDYAALQLVCNVLGGYSLARLFTILREEKGYTYGAYAFPRVLPHSATIEIVTSVGNEYTADTVGTLATELRRLSTELIDAEELENAKQQLLGAFARDNETPQQTTGLVMTMVNNGLPMDHYTRHVAKLQMLRPEHLLPVQQRYFDVARWTFGCSGKPEVLRPALEHYVASVEEWDPQSETAWDA